ncbi:MAG: TonB-dependent receptor [Rubrivivax sp.]|nr:TonB-dependent receptor [Rubrivivax sp.]
MPRSPAVSRYPSAFVRTALSAAAAIVVCAPALAQNTTAAINGRITGADGKPVAAASVTILHVESRSTSTVTTDAEGRYGARGLRVGGPYTITVSKGGLTEKRDNVFLTLAETTALDLALGAPAAQTIVVTGQAASERFNSSNIGAGTNISGRQLQALASIQRNLQDYARTDPRISQTDKERGEISAGGQNSRYNSITIDGVTVSDTFGLEANNLPTAKQPISIDAIQSVQVNISNIDVTQKGYTGANINAVTKSGTNDFKGSVYYVWRSDEYAGQRFNRTNNTFFNFLPFQETTRGLTLGGPLVKDRLFFFASYEELKSGRAQPEFGPVGSALTNVAITQTAIDRLKTAAQSQYGIDVGNVIDASSLLVKDSLLKLDWNISNDHRASVRWSKTDQSDTNNGTFGSYSPTSLQLTSQWWQQEKSIETLVGQWFADWTPTFSTELKVSTRDYRSVPKNNATLPAMAFQFSGPAPAGSPAGVNTGNRFLNFGTEQSRHFNVLETQTLDAYLGATWVLGRHELKFGADLSDNEVYNAFFQNTNGNYTFGCVNSSATYTYTFGAINCGTATAAQIEAAIFENFQRGRPSSYQVQLAAPGLTLDDGIAKWNLRDTGLFLQDTWKVNDKLSVVAGVRLDTLSTGDKPRFNAAAAAPRVAGSVNGNLVTRSTGGFGLDNSNTVDGDELIQPRIGFNYNFDPKAARKMQLRGGLGLFQGAAANVWLSNPYSNTGLFTRVIGCGTLGFAACPPGGGVFSANPATQPTNFTGASPAANVDFLQPGLSQPAVWKFNLALDAELPWHGLTAGVEWLLTREKSGIYYKHLNLGDAVRTGPDGRELYYTPAGYSPSCWSATGGMLTTANTVCASSATSAGARTRALANSAFNNVLLASETSKGTGNALTLSLSGPSRAALNWQVAYTRTAAEEVSPLTSSVANSNFNSRSIFNPNEEVAGRSAYLIRDRVSAAATWSAPLIGKYRTTVGLFYEGRKGKPYSWTYRNDLNGDGVSGNDLMYIPTAPGSGDVEFAGATPEARAAAEARFWSVVSAFPELNAARGQVVRRNGSYSPWVNSFDMRVSQEVPGLWSGHKGVLTIDILNVGNLLSSRWGRINEIGFSSAGGQRRTFVSYGGINAQGKYVYIVGDAADDLTLRQGRGESQWAAQITLRYEF